MKKELGETVTISSLYNEFHQEYTRPATDLEKDILFNIVFGAVLAVKYDGATASTAANTAEYIALRMLNYIQTYLCVYAPIKKICSMEEGNA